MGSERRCKGKEKGGVVVQLLYCQTHGDNVNDKLDRSAWEKGVEGEERKTFMKTPARIDWETGMVQKGMGRADQTCMSGLVAHNTSVTAKSS